MKCRNKTSILKISQAFNKFRTNLSFFSISQSVAPDTEPKLDPIWDDVRSRGSSQIQTRPSYLYNESELDD